MANQATMERRITKTVPTAEELDEMVNGRSRFAKLLVGREFARRHIFSAGRRAKDITSWVRNLPPARWLSRLFGEVRSRFAGMGKRWYIAGAIAVMLTPQGRSMVDKTLRFIGRATVRVGHWISKALAWPISKLGKPGKKVAGYVEFAPMVAGSQVARAYDASKKWLSATLPLENRVTRFIGHAGAAYTAGGVLGRVLPASWARRVGAWLQRSAIAVIALAGAEPWLRDKVDWLDRFTRKLEGTEVPQVQGPTMLSRDEAQRTVLDRTLALHVGDHKYANDQEMAADLLKQICPPLLAAYPKVVVEQAAARFAASVCPWDVDGDLTTQRAVMAEILQRELSDASVGIPADTPSETGGKVYELNDETLEMVHKDLQEAERRGQLVGVGVQTGKPKVVPPAAKQRNRRRRH